MPDTALPDIAQPDAAQPDAAQPDVAQPDATQPDAGTTGCDLRAAGWSFSVPLPLDEVNSISIDRDPSLSADGLTLYFSSNRSGGLGDYDIYSATRAQPGDPFDAPVNEVGLSSSADDAKVVFTEGESNLFIATRRSGGAGQSDIWSAQRGASDTYENFAPLANVNTNQQEYDPHISLDGLRLYFASFVPEGGGLGGQDLVVSTRASTALDFSLPQLIAELSTSAGDADPWLSADELIIIYNSRQSAALAGANIYLAQRGSPDETFSAPIFLAELNTNVDEADPVVSANGCELIFASNRAGGVGGWDLWISYYQVP